MQIVTVHPFDPWGEKVGGVETLVRLMLTHAPPEAQLSVIGVSEDDKPVGEWLPLDWGGRPVNFYGLLRDDNPNRRKFMPLSLRFAWALRKLRCDFTSLQSQRNLLAFHSDPKQWVSAASEVKWKHAPWLYRMVEARAVANAEVLSGVNAATVDTLKRRYPARGGAIRRVSTTYRSDMFYPAKPDERERLRGQFAEKFQFNPEGKWVLFAGRLEQQKAPLLALEAFARAKQLAPGEELALIVIGQGGLLDAMKRRAYELRISDSVLFLGAQPQARVAEWMRAADVFLMTSSFEGLPIALLEAQACGLPAVAGKAGDIGEVVCSGQNGELVERQDADMYTNALIKILSMNRETISEQCVQAVQTYTPKEVISEWLQ